MIFIDASFYLSLLNSKDNNHKQALKIGKKYENESYITSQAVLGEVLTVGSQRYDKPTTIKFIETIIKSQTKIVLEKQEIVDNGLKIFKKARSKNISWVDCYSFAIMKKLKIKIALSFDKHFQQFNKQALDYEKINS